MNHIKVLLISLLIVSISCKEKVEQQQNEQVTKSDDNKVEAEIQKDEMQKDVATAKFTPQSTDPQTAANITNFLVNDFLKEDISFLQPNDRKFQFYKIDLNQDGNEEIFVRFFSPYFCGSGGCTFLLLDKYGEIITKFSVTRAPIFVEPSAKNGWSILLVRDAGVFKELIFSEGSYPSNPSMLSKAPYDAPSGHAQVMFDDDMYPCQTFEF